MNLEDRIRNSIDRRTDADVPDSFPPGLRRRARRRVAATVATTLIALSVLGSGTVLLVRNLADGTTRPADPAPTEPSITAPSSPTREQFMGEFMQARVDGSGAEAFLSDEAAAHYDDPTLTPALYGDESREVRFGEHTISVTNVDGSSDWQAYVRTRILYPGDSAPCPATEVFVIDTRQDDGGASQEFVIRSVNVLQNGWTTGPLDTLAAEELVCAFMEARLGEPRSGAQSFLSDQSADQYHRGEGGLELYPGQPHAGFWWILRSEESGDSVRVVITLNNTGQPDAIYEELLIGPCCVSAGGERRVLSAARLTCEEAQGSAEFCG